MGMPYMLKTVERSSKGLAAIAFETLQVDAESKPSERIEGEPMQVVVEIDDLAGASGLFEAVGENGRLFKEHGGEEVAKVFGCNVRAG
jgi:hypothetical protein